MSPEKKELQHRIEASGTVYPLAKRWKVTMITMGVICCLTVILLPLGIMCFIPAKKARVITGDEGVVIKWFGTRVIRWDEFASFQQMPFNVYIGGAGLGLAGAVALGMAKGAIQSAISGPIRYTLKPKGSSSFAAHWMAGSGAMVAEMEARTGMTIVAKKLPK